MLPGKDPPEIRGEMIQIQIQIQIALFTPEGAIQFLQSAETHTHIHIWESVRSRSIQQEQYLK